MPALLVKPTCLGISIAGTIVYEIAPDVHLGVNAWGEVRCSCKDGQRSAPVRVSNMHTAIACEHVHQLTGLVQADLLEMQG